MDNDRLGKRREELLGNKRRSGSRLLPVHGIIGHEIFVIVLPVLPIGQLVEPVPYRLAGGSVESARVVQHDTVSRRTPDARPVGQATFIDSQTLIPVPVVLQEIRPLDLCRIGGEINVLPPAIRLQAVRLVYLFLRHGALGFIAILVRQFRKAMAARLMMDQLRKDLVSLSQREVRHRRSLSPIALIGRGMRHITSPGIGCRIHRNKDQNIVHPVIPDRFPGVAQTGSVVAADFRPFSEPGSELLSVTPITFSFRHHINLIYIEIIPVTLVWLNGEERVQHLPHDGTIRSVLNLILDEGVSHQYQINALAFRSFLESNYVPV